VVRTLVGHTRSVECCDIKPDGQIIISASKDNTLKIWDGLAREELISFPFLGSVQCIAFHPKKPLILCGDRGGNIYILALVGI
jgi:WD40 repeat protein